jgi:hypothetical protein
LGFNVFLLSRHSRQDEQPFQAYYLEFKDEAKYYVESLVESNLFTSRFEVHDLVWKKQEVKTLAANQFLAILLPLERKSNGLQNNKHHECVRAV